MPFWSRMIGTVRALLRRQDTNCISRAHKRVASTVTCRIRFVLISSRLLGMMVLTFSSPISVSLDIIR